MSNPLQDFQDALIIQRVAAAAKRKAPAKKAPSKKEVSKPELVNVGKKESDALDILRNSVGDAISDLKKEMDYVKEKISDFVEDRRDDENPEKPSDEMSYPTGDAVSIPQGDLFKGVDHLGDVLELNERITKEFDLTKAVQAFAKQLDIDKDPREDPKAMDKALGLLEKAEKAVPKTLTSPGTLGKLRECFEFMAQAINTLSKNSIKVPAIPNAIEPEDPRQLGFGFSASVALREFKAALDHLQAVRTGCE